MDGYSKSCQYSNRLLEKLKLLDNKSTLNFALINKAMYWAKRYHDGQFRKSGEPFYTHPFEVAYIISDYNLKTDIIVVSILHDIIEDTEVTVEMCHWPGILAQKNRIWPAIMTGFVRKVMFLLIWTQLSHFHRNTLTK